MTAYRQSKNISNLNINNFLWSLYAGNVQGEVLSLDKLGYGWYLRNQILYHC